MAAHSASQDLLPGASVLTGLQFMSTQRIFDIFSELDVKDRAIHRIPTAPKSNCFFILNVEQELLDYEKSAKNKLKIQDRLRDGTGAWDEMSIFNHNFFKIEGVLTWVRVNKLKGVQPPYDLRAHRATYFCTISSSSER